jgi:hypothetical protein
LGAGAAFQMQPKRRIIAALKIQHMRRNFFLGIGNDDALVRFYGFRRALEFREIVFRLRVIPPLKSVNTNHEFSRSLGFVEAALSTDLGERGHAARPKNSEPPPPLDADQTASTSVVGSILRRNI